tara:strand:+ start:20613 stop:22046 length:1434 start_codon:yes stop_codon:yes gene_type:complete
MPTNSSPLLYPVILSGGSGSRLWPLSRELHPKQLQSIHSNLTLLQETVIRISEDQFADPLIVCNENHRFIVAENLKAIDIKPKSIVLEKEGRNTAPAAAIASLIIMQQTENPIILLVPSDHVIQDEVAFRSSINKAQEAARNGSIVTLGITPTHPETAYGYIKKSKPIENCRDCYQIGSFIEKPSAVKAQEFLLNDEYYWNSGIFIFKASVFLDELKKFSPTIYDNCLASVTNSISDTDFQRLDYKFFNSCPSISIDYAVMEKTHRACVIPVDMKWSDVGSWDALWQLLDKDENGNVLSGDVLVENTSSSLLRSEGKLLTGIGLENLIVVSTEDATLICNKDSAQDVKTIVNQLKSAERPEHVSHTTVHRPWGWYTIKEKQSNFQIKVINLKPGAKISLQLHQKRAEHWVVVKGIATVTKGRERFELKTNESTYIPIGIKHRLENKTENELKIVEVQSGDYLEEDDITRFDDKYGRK